MNKTIKTTATSGSIGLGTLCLLTSIILIVLHACGVLSCALWLCFLPVIIWAGLIVAIVAIGLLVWLIMWLITVIIACIAAR